MIVVRINGEVVRATGASWSSVDPGGFEACNFAIPSDTPYPLPGADITVYDGLQLVWQGRVEEPGDNYNAEGALGQVSGVGYGARLRDDSVSMIFIDRDLSRWQGMTTSRRASIATTINPQNDGSQVTDDAGAPAIRLDLSGALPGSSGGVAEIFYDAGEFNLIKQVQWSSTQRNVNSGSGNWFTALWSATDSTFDPASNISGNLGGSGDIAFRRDTFGTTRRWALIQLGFIIALATTDERYRMIQDIAVLGDHGISPQQVGAGQDGFYPSQIVQWVEDQIAFIDRGVIQVADTFIAQQVAYHDRVPYEQVVNDMAVLMGWHWGVWEPLGFNLQPRLDFRQRPSSPTAFVDRRDCSQITLSKSFSSMYNVARVVYQDAFGHKNATSVSLPHPEIIGIQRVIDLDIGIGDESLAQLFGRQVLQLSQSDSRANGSVTLPSEVITPNGLMPSHFLRAGLDRLKVQGLPVSSLTDSIESNAYRVKRVTSQQIGTHVQTTIEVDNGADLIETINARLAIQGISVNQWFSNPPGWMPGFGSGGGGVRGG